MMSAQLGNGAVYLLDALTDFLNEVVVSGQGPEWIRPIFYGARLIALSKSDNGIRPITMGLTLRRLAAKVALSKTRDVCEEVFHPHQLGLGIPRGAK